jgi:hypothetical protein
MTSAHSPNGATGDDELIEAGDDQFIFLDEGETWALWLPRQGDEGIVVHAHEPAGDELLFYECDAVELPDGRALVRCPDCGATIAEAELDALIAALPDGGA